MVVQVFARKLCHVTHSRLSAPLLPPNQDVRKEMDAGTWLCPHCYEDEHPEEGWMCNSSICMKRRGYKPTGIAIYDAQQRGFPSVAHWLQSQMRKRTTALIAGPAGSDESAAGDVAAGISKRAVKEPSKDVTPAAATESCDSVEAPNTPMKDSSDAASSVVTDAVIVGGGRVTRGSAAAGAVAVEVQVAKRACVNKLSGARRSLRMAKQ